MGSAETKKAAKLVDGVAVACQSFQPLRWSHDDTRLTQDQATEHNAVYKRLCQSTTK